MFDRVFEAFRHRDARKAPGNRAWVEWSDHFRPSHVSPWVHHAVTPGVAWNRAAEYDPPFPPHVPGKGHPVIQVTFGGILLRFASLAEIDHVIRVFEAPKLPDPGAVARRFIELGRLEERFAREHWLDRLPRDVRYVAFRRQCAEFLREQRPKLEREIAGAAGER